MHLDAKMIPGAITLIPGIISIFIHCFVLSKLLRLQRLRLGLIKTGIKGIEILAVQLFLEIP